MRKKLFFKLCSIFAFFSSFSSFFFIIIITTIPSPSSFLNDYNMRAEILYKSTWFFLTAFVSVLFFIFFSSIHSFRLFVCVWFMKKTDFYYVFFLPLESHALHVLQKCSWLFFWVYSIFYGCLCCMYEGKKGTDCMQLGSNKFIIYIYCREEDDEDEENFLEIYTYTTRVWMYGFGDKKN